MKRLFLAGATVVAMMCSGAAMARVDVGISIGIPGVIYSEPDFYYPPPVRYVERPRVIVVPERVYSPVPVYRSRYYRDEYRGRGHYKSGKHWKEHKHEYRRGDRRWRD